MALRIVPARYEASNLHPVVAIKLLWRHVFTAAVLLDGPLEKTRLAIGPILLSCVRFLALQRRQLAEDLGRNFVRYDGLVLVEVFDCDGT